MGNADDNDTSHYEGALLEDIMDKIQRLTEAMAEVPSDVRQLKQEVGQLRQDVTVVKAVVTDQSSEMREFDSRVGALEAVAA